MLPAVAVTGGINPLFTGGCITVAAVEFECIPLEGFVTAGVDAVDVTVAEATAAAALRSILIDKRDALRCILAVDKFPLLVVVGGGKDTELELVVVGGGGNDTGLELVKALPLRNEDKDGMEESSSTETSLLTISVEDSTCCDWEEKLVCCSVTPDCEGSDCAVSLMGTTICDNCGTSSEAVVSSIKFEFYKLL